MRNRSRRQPRRSAIRCAGAAGVLFLSACGGGSDGSAAKGATTTIAAPTTTTTLVDLATLVAPPPPGFSRIVDAPPGPFTLENYATDYSLDPVADRALLTSAGFVRGYQQAYVDGARSPTVLAVFIFEFRDPPSATTRGQLLKAGPDDKPFAVPAIRDAAGVSSFVPVGKGRERAHAIAFVRGTRVVVVAAQHTNLQASTSAVIAFAKTEAALVP